MTPHVIIQYYRRYIFVFNQPALQQQLINTGSSNFAKIFEAKKFTIFPFLSCKRLIVYSIQWQEIFQITEAKQQHNSKHLT
jgi:hypothetical protein